MIGLATSSRQIHAEQSLKRAGLYDYFDGKVFGDTVKEGKPSPEIYLKACKSIGIEPEDAVALEDAPSGAISALCGRYARDRCSRSCAASGRSKTIPMETSGRS